MYIAFCRRNKHYTNIKHQIFLSIQVRTWPIVAKTPCHMRAVPERPFSLINSYPPLIPVVNGALQSLFIVFLGHNDFWGIILSAGVAQ